MKIIISLFLIQYSIYLNCFFRNFDINIFCKYLSTYKGNDYILFYCKEKDGLDVYKYNFATKNISIVWHIKGNKNTIYFIDFIGNTEVIVKVTPKVIKITIHKIYYNSRKFIYTKILKNNSSINEFTEDVFVDVNCDGYNDILIPTFRYYKTYIFVRERKRIFFKFLKKLNFGFFETVRKATPYDNMWFKIGFVLPKVFSYKYKKICFNLVYYSSSGIIYLYKDTFKRKIARINTSKIKDKYKEFIVYPKPQPFIYCNDKCSVIHFSSKKGVIYQTYLYYPYKENQTQFVEGTIINFSHISRNIFWVLYLPKMGFLGFYELLKKNILEIKLGLVKNENSRFSLLFEIPLIVKINFKEKNGFITIQSGNFVCILEKSDALEITFSEKDAVYKYTFKIRKSKDMVDITEKLKTENPIKIFEKYECVQGENSVIINTLEGNIKYYESR